MRKGENAKDTGWTEKKQAIQEDFIWGELPESVYQITRAEYKTEPDSIKLKDLIRLSTENCLPKRNTYHNRVFFWAKQSGRLLEMADRDRKRMQVQHNFSRRITDIKVYHRQKTTGQNND